MKIAIEAAEIGNTKKNKKKIIFDSKKEFGKACFIFAVCKKRLKLGYPPPLFPSMLKYLILV